MPWSCVRSASGRSGGSGQVLVLAPPFPRVPRGACCGLSRPGVPFPRLPPHHSMRSVRSAALVWLPFGSAPRVRWVWVRSCSCSVRASSPPPRVGVVRAPRVVLVQGASRAVPGGACPSAFPASVPCSAYLLLGGGGGPVPSSSCLAWGCSQPSARACPGVLALRALGAARGRPGGRALFIWVWGVGGWALSRARPPILGACGRGSLPTGCGWGQCRRGDPPPTPQRALLRAGFARCRSNTRAPREGLPLAWEWGTRGWALSNAR